MCVAALLILALIAASPPTAASPRAGDGAAAAQLVGPERPVLLTVVEHDPGTGEELPSRVEVLDVDGSRRPLVDGPAADPVWAQDGSLVAYRAPDGMYVVDPSGGQPRGIFVGDVTPAAFAVDDRVLLAVRRDDQGSTELLGYDLAGGIGISTGVATDGVRQDSVRADARLVTGDRRDDDSGLVDLVALNPTFTCCIPEQDRRVLVEGWEGDDVTAWSPDGSRLAVRSGPALESIAVLDGEGAAPRVLPDVPAALVPPLWTPDGDSLVYSGGADLVVADPDGREPARLVDTGDGVRRVVDVGPFLDATQVVAHLELEDGRSRLVSIDVRDGRQTVQTDEQAVAYAVAPVAAIAGPPPTPPDIQAPGRALIVLDFIDFFPAPQLGTMPVIVEPDGTERAFPVRATATLPSWSPDGSWIAYDGPPPDDDPVGRAVYVVDRAAVRPRLVASGVSLMGGGAWSPDGAALLVFGHVENGEAGLGVLDIATGEIRRLDSGPDAMGRAAAWSPDGTQVASLRREADGTAALVVQGRDGGPAEVIGRGLVEPSAIRWSSDGARIAVEGTDGARVIELADGAVSRTGDQHQDVDALDPTLRRRAFMESDELVVTTLAGGEISRTRVPVPLGMIGGVHLWTSEVVLVALRHHDDRRRNQLLAVDLGNGGIRVVDRGRQWQATAVDPSAPRPPMPAATARSLWWSGQRPDDSADTVLIGRADDHADSLASGGLQGSADAPLLLTPTDRLADEVAMEIRRLGATSAVVLGGPSAVSPEVESAVAALGMDVDRAAGPTRIDTAVAVAERMPAARRIVLARAFGDDADPTRAYADALAGGALAATLDSPLLLTPSDGLAPQVAAWLDRTSSVTEVLVLGGEAAISADVVTDLENRGLAVRRLAGADRAGTAAAIRDAMAEASSAPLEGSPIVIDGEDPAVWADGFAAAGVTDVTDGGGILLAGTDAAYASIARIPTTGGVRCSGLMRQAVCAPHEVAMEISSRPAALRAESEVDGHRLVAEWRVGLGFCLVATIEDAGQEGPALAEVHALAGDGQIIRTVPAAPDGIAAATCEPQQVRGPHGPPTPDAIRWVLRDGRQREAPVQDTDVG